MDVEEGIVSRPKAAFLRFLVERETRKLWSFYHFCSASSSLVGSRSLPAALSMCHETLKTISSMRGGSKRLNKQNKFRALGICNYVPLIYRVIFFILSIRCDFGEEKHQQRNINKDSKAI